MPSWVGPAITAGAGLLGSALGGGGQKGLDFIDDSYYGKKIQSWLPTPLRYQTTEPIIKSGLAGIADLIARPGRLSPGISEAIAPRIAVESERIARDFAGTRQNVAGSLARGNAPVSIKGALEASMATNERRAQGELRRGALMESEQLRRADLSQVYDIISAIQSFMNPRLGVAAPLVGQQMQIGQQNAAANQAAIADLLGSLGNINWGGGKSPSPSWGGGGVGVPIGGGGIGM